VEPEAAPRLTQASQLRDPVEPEAAPRLTQASQLRDPVEPEAAPRLTQASQLRYHPLHEARRATQASQLRYYLPPEGNAPPGPATIVRPASPNRRIESILRPVARNELILPGDPAHGIERVGAQGRELR
ncbi:MAG: hypothetical protein MI919_11135, partial [Holophagales bacterium]|nr:hypothetical protein [Holophagales bacterium]